MELGVASCRYGLTTNETGNRKLAIIILKISFMFLFFPSKNLEEFLA